MCSKHLIHLIFIHSFYSIRFAYCYSIQIWSANFPWCTSPFFLWFSTMATFSVFRTLSILCLIWFCCAFWLFRRHLSIFWLFSIVSSILNSNAWKCLTCSTTDWQLAIQLVSMNRWILDSVGGWWDYDCLYCYVYCLPHSFVTIRFITVSYCMFAIYYTRELWNVKCGMWYCIAIKLKFKCFFILDQLHHYCIRKCQCHSHQELEKRKRKRVS